MRPLDIVADGEVIRVAVPESFWERFTGLRHRTGPMLFRGSSVHGIGMDRPLTVLAIGQDRRVLAVRPLRPGGLVLFRGAKWMLEIEPDMTAPAVGTALHFYSPIHDRTASGVRHPDRKSG